MILSQIALISLDYNNPNYEVYKITSSTLNINICCQGQFHLHNLCIFTLDSFGLFHNECLFRDSLLSIHTSEIEWKSSTNLRRFMMIRV